MADSKRAPSDATDYSSTKSAETQKEAEQRDQHPADPRLLPGGALGAKIDPGMSSLDRKTGEREDGENGGRENGRPRDADGE